jgi:hypothetical protein
LLFVIVLVLLLMFIGCLDRFTAAAAPLRPVIYPAPHANPKGGVLSSRSRDP